MLLFYRAGMSYYLRYLMIFWSTLIISGRQYTLDIPSV